MLSYDYNSDEVFPFGLFNIESEEQIPLYFVDINANIVDQFAKIKITHKYFNPTEQIINTIFRCSKTLYHVFDGLTVEMNEVTKVSLIGKKEEIDLNFKNEEEKGSTVVKAETVEVDFPFTRSSVFLEARIGNISPKESINLTFSIIQQLDISLNKKFSLKLPLMLTPKFIPSYTISGLISKFVDKIINEDNAIKEQTDIRYIKKDNNLYYQYDITVKVNSSVAIKKIEAKNNNPTVITKIDDFHAIISFDNSNINIPSEDFELVYEISQEELMKPKLLFTKHPKFDDDYAFWYSFFPSQMVQKELVEQYVPLQHFEGNFVFCIDRSGSMYGGRMTMAKQSLLYFIHSLPDTKSKFDIISFGDYYTSLFDKFLKVKQKYTEKAVSKIENFDADMGCTYLKGGLEHIIHLARKSKKKTRVFIITDGYLFDKEECLHLIEESANEFDIKYFSLGIGDECDEELVREIADKGYGKFEFSKKENDIVEKVIYLLESSMQIYLSDFKLSMQKTPQNFYSNFYSKKFKNKILQFNEPFDLYGILPKEFANDNAIECSFSLPFKEKMTFSTRIPFELAEVKKTDILHKMIIGTYYHKEIDLCLKYQILGDNTSFYCLVKESNLTPEEMIQKHVEKMKNIVPLALDKTLFVKTLTGKTISVKYNENMTIEQLKNIIFKREGIPVQQQRMEYAGKHLSNYNLIKDYSIKNDSVLHLVLRLRGGPIEYHVPVLLENKREDIYFHFETYEKMREHVSELMNINEEEYDFVINEVIVTNEFGKMKQLPREIKLIKKAKEEAIPLEIKILKNQKTNGLWEVNDNFLSLVNLSKKEWSQLIKNNKDFFESVIKCKDENVLINMYIIHFITTHFKDKLPRFKLVLQKTEIAIKKMLSIYSKELQVQFNNKCKLL